MTATLTRTTEIIEPTATKQATAAALTALHRATEACAFLDPDLLNSTTDAGRAVVTLATLAREAAAALGTPPGPRLRGGPGVVVVRDLVRAVTLLETAAADAGGGIGPADATVDPSQEELISLVGLVEAASARLHLATRPAL